jgi:hypothetical protein
MLGGFIASNVNAALDFVPIMHTETFESHTGVGYGPARSAIVTIITVVLILLLLLTVGQYLWNNVLVALVPGVKPAKSVLQILGLAILISLLAPGNCQC